MSKNFRETLEEELKKPEFKEEWEKLKQRKKSFEEEAQNKKV